MLGRGVASQLSSVPALSGHQGVKCFPAQGATRPLCAQLCLQPPHREAGLPTPPCGRSLLDAHGVVLPWHLHREANPLAQEPGPKSIWGVYFGGRFSGGFVDFFSWFKIRPIIFPLYFQKWFSPLSITTTTMCVSNHLDFKFKFNRKNNVKHGSSI